MIKPDGMSIFKDREEMDSYLAVMQQKVRNPNGNMTRLVVPLQKAMFGAGER